MPAFAKHAPLGLLACAASASAAAAIAACSAGSATAKGTSGAPDATSESSLPAPDSFVPDSPERDSPSNDGDGGSAGETGIPGWVLTWSDEFDGPDGSAVDPSKWTQVVGQGPKGNAEMEYYTAGTANAVVQSGSLVITATTQGASQYTCTYGTCLYTSARMDTFGKFAQAYGRFEARIQIPRGQGLWPAFWMEGNDKGTVGWPACGEIDIMENIGSRPSTDYGSIHGPNPSGTPIATDVTGNTSLPDGAALADDFHVYALEWEAGTVRFYLDQVLFETRTPADNPDAAPWVYDHPFFLILNVAVGGYWPGDPNATTHFPQTMLVDYVRVYSKAP
jgi:beta-glucanase (GH16 family)